MKGEMKVLLVSSIGGHLAELLELVPALGDAERVWVLNDPSPVLPVEARAYIIAHAERDWRVLWNVAELAAIFARERPDVVLSMGAGPAVPAALVARAGGVPFLYIEPSSAVRVPTLTGRLMRWLTPYRWAQWPELAQKIRARYVGGIL